MDKQASPLVAYLRVSRRSQEASGLGLEAQRETIARHAEAAGRPVLVEFVEVESGKRNDRPELARALALTKRVRATLVIARLDRLARSARFLLSLIEGGADVAFCDFPNLPPGPPGKFVLTTLAGVAELEAGLISERTRAALAAAKARGVRLGTAARSNATPEGRARGQAEAARVRQARIEAHRAEVLPRARELFLTGLSQRAIAMRLNDEGFRTRTGGEWHQVGVKRLLETGKALSRTVMDENLIERLVIQGKADVPGEYARIRAADSAESATDTTGSEITPSL